MNFPSVDAALRAAIRGEQLAGVSYAIFRRHQVLTRNCLGSADRETRRSPKPISAGAAHYTRRPFTLTC